MILNRKQATAAYTALEVIENADGAGRAIYPAEEGARLVVSQRTIISGVSVLRYARNSQVTAEETYNSLEHFASTYHVE